MRPILLHEEKTLELLLRGGNDGSFERPTVVDDIFFISGEKELINPGCTIMFDACAAKGNVKLVGSHFAIHGEVGSVLMLTANLDTRRIAYLDWFAFSRTAARTVNPLINRAMQFVVDCMPDSKATRRKLPVVRILHIESCLRFYFASTRESLLASWNSSELHSTERGECQKLLTSSGEVTYDGWLYVPPIEV